MDSSQSLGPRYSHAFRYILIFIHGAFAITFKWALNALLSFNIPRKVQNDVCMQEGNFFRIWLYSLLPLLKVSMSIRFIYMIIAIICLSFYSTRFINPISVLSKLVLNSIMSYLRLITLFIAFIAVPLTPYTWIYCDWYLLGLIGIVDSINMIWFAIWIHPWLVPKWYQSFFLNHKLIPTPFWCRSF